MAFRYGMFAEIFRPTSPDFPMPVTTTRPLQFKSNSTALSKEASSRDCKSCNACASMRSTRSMFKLMDCPILALAPRAASDAITTVVVAPVAGHSPRQDECRSRVVMCFQEYSVDSGCHYPPAPTVR